MAGTLGSVLLKEKKRKSEKQKKKKKREKIFYIVHETPQSTGRILHPPNGNSIPFFFILFLLSLNN